MEVMKLKVTKIDSRIEKAVGCFKTFIYDGDCMSFNAYK
jgi:hypothetical protein